MNNNWFEAIEIVKDFDGIKVLDKFSCTLKKGEILGIMGSNGCGKSTFFNVITGIFPSKSGKIFFKGKDISNLNPVNIANHQISRTFQNIRLIAGLSVKENVMLSFKHQPGEQLLNQVLNWKKCKIIEKVNLEKTYDLLNKVGLKNRAKSFPTDLSFGQRKRLTLACCLASNAELLLLDELFSGMDSYMVDATLSLLRSLPEAGKSVILIEHNWNIIEQACSRLIFMDMGTNFFDGTPTDARQSSDILESYLR